MVQKILITGGAGFIGSNIVKRYLNKGAEVVVLDNLSREGTAENLAWLRTLGEFTFIKADIRDQHAMEQAFAAHRDVDVVLHLAGQVAVTTSVVNPREDFEINALGTFNVLEAIRLQNIKPIVLCSSTNKVYGGMEEIATVERDGQYEYRDHVNGIGEDINLDFHSPYGCSKGAAEQYVRDYSRIYGIPTVVFRQSCIYGFRQMGMEDQGWVAWFTICAILGKKLSIYGDGKQVRDALFVEDLVDAYDAAIANIDKTSGRIYNVGGGPGNKLSLLRLIAQLEELSGTKMDIRFDDWRPGDQPVFVCDISKARNEFGWEPKTSLTQGIRLLYDWVKENEALFQEQHGVKATKSGQ